MHHDKEQQKMNERTSPDPPDHALFLSIKLGKRRHIDPFLRSAAIKSLLCHILFVRGILPVPSQECLRAAAEAVVATTTAAKSNQCSTTPPGAGDCAKSNKGTDTAVDAALSTAQRQQPRRRTKSRVQKKMAKAGTELLQLLLDLDCVLGCASSATEQQASEHHNNQRQPLGWNVNAAVITLGPSVRSPREQYLLRFHSAPAPSDGPSQQQKQHRPPPREVRNRLESELGRRASRELMQGTLDPKFAATMFSRTGCGGSTSSRRVSVTLCVNRQALNEVLQPGDGASVAVGSDAGTLPLARRIVIQRNFALRVPKMISRKKKVHRPFVVMDLQAAGSSAGEKTATPDTVNPHTPAVASDVVWIGIRSKVKGFRL